MLFLLFNSTNVQVSIPTCPPFFSTIAAKIPAQNGQTVGVESILTSGATRRTFINHKLKIMYLNYDGKMLGNC